MKQIYLLLFTLTLSFALSQAQGTISVGILGDALNSQGNGFGGPDLDLVNQGDDVNFFLSNVTLTASLEGLKFRQDNNWAINWGNDGFPNGQGFLNGSNIDTQAGTFDVYFRIDTATGNAVYSFQSPGVFPAVGMLGDAVVGASFASPDLNFTTADGIIYTANNVDMVNGNFKLRQDDDWSINWGWSAATSLTFNSGVATTSVSNDFSGNTTNIFMDTSGTSGKFNITFNRHTGELTFTDSTLSLSDLTQNSIKAQFVGNELVVNGLNDEVTISGYDLLGRKLFSVQRRLSGNFRESLPMPENQIGIVRIESPSFSKTLKVATIR